ncbi:hypothetical protein V5799_002615 [Amblyomma americanum]|uniref:Uncharacterized protein n=1 Tax=Amblyomma americanum TaxID=6943 RepID=A0AAQ4DBB2_AMBAM
MTEMKAENLIFLWQRLKNHDGSDMKTLMRRRCSVFLVPDSAGRTVDRRTTSEASPTGARAAASCQRAAIAGPDAMPRTAGCAERRGHHVKAPPRLERRPAVEPSCGRRRPPGHGPGPQGRRLREPLHRRGNRLGFNSPSDNKVSRLPFSANSLGQPVPWTLERFIRARLTRRGHYGH